MLNNNMAKISYIKRDFTQINIANRKVLEYVFRQGGMTSKVVLWKKFSFKEFNFSFFR